MLGNILENVRNFSGKSWKNLGKLREIFWKVSRNIAGILEKYFKNFENYCEEFDELFYKILNSISSLFENHVKKFQNISRNTSDIFEKYHFGEY